MTPNDRATQLAMLPHNVGAQDISVITGALSKKTALTHSFMHHCC